MRHSFSVIKGFYLHLLLYHYVYINACHVLFLLYAILEQMIYDYSFLLVLRALTLDPSPLTLLVHLLCCHRGLFQGVHWNYQRRSFQRRSAS